MGILKGGKRRDSARSIFFQAGRTDHGSAVDQERKTSLEVSALWRGQPLGDVWSDRLLPVWQRLAGEELDAWEPNFNFYQEYGSYKLEAEIPGVDQEDISVTIGNNVLTVSGKKKQRVEEQAKYYMREAAYGYFSRSLRLPEKIEADRVRAKFKDGVLQLTLSPKKHCANQKIKIEG